MFKCSDFLADRYPYNEPSFHEKFMEFEAKMTLGHGVDGIERVFALLERTDVLPEEKERGLLVLVQKLSSQETKIKLDLQGLVCVLTEVIRQHRDHPRILALALECLSEAVFVPSTVGSLGEEGTMPLLLDAFSWHRDEDFQANLARVFYALSTNSQGMALLLYFRGQKYDTPDAEELRMDFMGFDRVSEEDRGDLVPDPHAPDVEEPVFSEGEPDDATHRGVVCVLTESLARPLLFPEAARLTLKTLMALAHHPRTLAIGCRCGTIPALLGVLQEAAQQQQQQQQHQQDASDASQPTKLAEAAADALWQYCLDYKAKAQSSGAEALRVIASWLLVPEPVDREVELQRALLMCLSTVGVHLQAKLEGAQHAEEVVVPMCRYYVRLAQWETPEGSRQEQERADLLENCILALRLFAEPPKAKEEVCRYLENEPTLMRFLFGQRGRTLLGSFGSSGDLIPKGMEHLLRPVIEQDEGDA